MHQNSLAETQELLTAVLERSPGDRERFVREHCADPVLCNTITALLKPRETAAGGPSGAAGPDRDLGVSIGSRVGPYIILRRLGKGGMGEVFLGQDPRLDRQVALKCLLSSSDGSEDLRARVIREARAAARITHSHVAAVYDVVEHEGRAFIVMEYVEGENLAAILKREALPAERVVAIGRQLAAALVAAHAGGVIHRDLKPANIQVARDGSVKILDFGIAVGFATVASTTTTATNFGVLAEPRGIQVGTPAYMSPEQLLGRPVDERSDLFSLSVILFEMATGRRPFRSDEPLDVLVESLKTPPRADSITSSVPKALANVIARGLATYPQDRFPSAAEMGRALDALGEEASSTGSQRGSSISLDGWLTARHLAWALAGVVSIPIALWSLGRITSAAFNTTLERTGSFAWEPAQAYVVWGFQSLVAPSVQAALAIVLLGTLLFVTRLLSLSRRLAHAFDSVRRTFRALAAKLGLDDPRVLAQGLATLGFVALWLVWWRFSALIQAWGVTVSTAEPERLLPLGPANEDEKVLYRAALTLLFLAFSAGLLRVVQLRRRLGTRGGAGGLAALIVVVAALLALSEVPYRILFRNEASLVEYNGMRCYVIGEDPQRWLLYRPDTTPPRNRIIQRNDPALHPSGKTEDIFTLPGKVPQ